MIPLQSPALRRSVGLLIASVPFLAGSLLTAGATQPSPAASPPAPVAAGAVPGQTVDLRLVDQIGGRSNALVVVGDTAYLGVGPRVWVLDLADPAAPRVTGMSEVLTGEVTGLVMADGLLVAACSGLYPGNSAVYVLDPAPAAGPATVGRAETTGVVAGEIRRAVPVAGGAILVSRTEATFVDLRRPESPVLIPFLPDLRRWWRDLVVLGHYGLASWGDSGPAALWVLDLSDPLEPDVVASLPVVADRLATDGDRLYAVHGELGRDPWLLTTVDVTEPRAPRLLGEAAVAPALGRIADAAVNEGLLYLTSLSGDLVAVDPTDPTAPRTLDQVNLAVEPVLMVPRGDALLMATHVYQEHNGPASGRGGLMSVAVGDPGQPRPAQILSSLPGRVTGVAVDGGQAYVTARDLAVADPGGLWAVDLGTTGQPRQLSFVDQPVGAGAVMAHAATVYASAADGLRVVDVTDPARPNLAGTVAVGEAATGMAARGNQAFVVARGGIALDVLDLTQPQLPRRLSRLTSVPPTHAEIYDSFFPLQVAPTGLALTDGYVHLAADGAYVVDVREPTWPRTIRRTSPSGPDSGKGGWPVRSVATDGDLLVYTSEAGLDVIDVSSLPNTSLVGRLADERLTGAHRVAVADGLALVARPDGAVTAVDLTVPAQPRIVAMAQLPLVACDETCEDENAIQQIVLDGDRALLAHDGSGLFVLALDRPLDPTPTPRATLVPPRGPRLFLPALLRGGRLSPPRGSLTLAGQWPPEGTTDHWAQGLALARGAVLTCAARTVSSEYGAECQLVTLDLRDPAAPAELGRSQPLPLYAEGPIEIVVDGSRALLALGAPGLAVVDIADLAHPRNLGRMPAENRVTALAAAGGLAFLADGRRLRVIDLADPGSPREVGRLDLDLGQWASIADLSLQAGLLLVAVRSPQPGPGLVAVDVADPQRPRVVGSALMGQSVLGLARSGHLAYAAPENERAVYDAYSVEMTSGVLVLDVRDPARIRQVGHRLGRSMGNVQALTWLDPATLITAGWWRVDALDVTDDALPRHLAGFPPKVEDGDPMAQWTYQAVAAEADQVYALGDGVLRVLRWTESD